MESEIRRMSSDFLESWSLNLDNKDSALMPESEETLISYGLSAGLETMRDTLDEEADTDKRGLRRAMNATAYRIFKLLQWLIQSPLSVDALNQRFQEEPAIGKPVSADSIWLYINTLKALGCQIRRPSPRNGFQYEMISHPFGLLLSERQLETLSQAKAYAQRQFSHQDMLILDGLLKKVVAYSHCDDPQQTVEQLFTTSRSFDYAGLADHIEALELAIAEGQLLNLVYLSPSKGQEDFCFLPTSLFYEQGVVYVRGERPEFATPSNLRIDRVVSLERVEQPEMQSRLIARQTQYTEIQLNVLVDSPELFTGVGLDSNQGVYDVQSDWVALAEMGPYYQVTLKVRETFYLKQRLLSLGLPFQVVAPAAFREELQQTLETMLAFYQKDWQVDHA